MKIITYNEVGIGKDENGKVVVVDMSVPIEEFNAYYARKRAEPLQRVKSEERDSDA